MSSDIRQVVEAAYDARRRNNLADIMPLLGDEPGYRLAGGTSLGILSAGVRGLAVMRETLADLIGTWDWTGMVSRVVAAEGETVIVHCAGTMRFVPTDTSFATELLDMVTVRDGKVVEVVEFADTQKVSELIRAAQR